MVISTKSLILIGTLCFCCAKQFLFLLQSNTLVFFSFFAFFSTALVLLDLLAACDTSD